ncbi:TlpA disulfide reductase family protein [Pedobacter sp. CFBP9032]|uniref:TlpA family protein disulfide reductase n=1 Tax=Pedobacter sp. CFBP9032 TaxID=3096539 RepID=UPI002A6B230D|nr:TlpA disulfide reductase family protein [Pedobacter sp. CFBP9032]MDY0904901.1 TlpA disulfide reductase family protein [Pedobacter sp. CFBP9032]
MGSLLVNAQTNNAKQNVLNETSVVRAEDGNVYPYLVWQKLMSTGKYGLKTRGTKTESGATEYLIFELSEAQKFSYFEKMPKPRLSDSFKEGDDFKGFKATDINGNKIDLREATGKVIVLNFWFINCPPCRQEIPQLNELVAKYKDNPDVVFLAIATDEKYGLQKFLKTTPYDYQVVPNGHNLASKYSVTLYPTHAIIDKNGKVKFSAVGLATNTIHWIKKSIDESLAAN